MYMNYLIVFSICYVAFGVLDSDESFINSPDSQISSFVDKRADEEQQQRVARYDAAVRHIMLGKRALSMNYDGMDLGKRAASINGERAFSMIGMGKRSMNSERAFSMIGMGKRAAPSAERAWSMMSLGR